MLLTLKSVNGVLCMNEPTKSQELRTHLLLTLATTLPVRDIDLSPQGCQYDLFQGVWIVNDTGELLVDSPDRPYPMTKKKDIETGEDQKGE